MYPSVKEVIPSDAYVLKVIFDNGESGLLDMKGVLDFGVFARIANPDAFCRVRVSFDTIAWDAGVDLDPEYVYAKCMQHADSVAEQSHAPDDSSTGEA